MVKTLADCIQNRVWAGQNDAMKTSAKNERGQGAAFTLLEIIAVVAVIAILAAVLTPRVITVMARGKVNGSAHSLARLKKATTDYIVKNGSLPTRDGTGSTNAAVTTGRFDADLVAGGFTDKLFGCAVGKQSFDETALTGRIHVRCVGANAAATVAPPTANAGGDNFDLDRDPATADFTSGQKIVAAFIPGVTIGDAIELNKILDGDTNSDAGADTTGRCIYSPATGDNTTTVYIYVAHH